MTTLDDIRTEYMRGLPDAYAGGPRVRAETWQRLADLIDAYATSQAPPTMTDSTNPEPPARKTAPRKARP